MPLAPPIRQYAAKPVVPLPSSIDVADDPIYSAGQCAAICRVAPRTFSKWCDAGLVQHVRLPNLRVPDQRGDRRIARSALIKFMRDHKLDLGLLGEGRILLAVGMTKTDLRPLVERGGADGFSVVPVDDGYAAGRVVIARVVSAAIVDAGQLGSTATTEVLCGLLGDGIESVAVLIGEDGTGAVGKSRSVTSETFRRPFDPEAVATWAAAAVRGWKAVKG